MTIKQLRVFILKTYGKRLNLMRVDACELTDLVAWGQMTEAELIDRLESMAATA